MRTPSLLSFVVLSGALLAGPAHAASVQNYSTRGTQTTVDSSVTDSTGCVNVFVDLVAVTSITRSDGTSSAGSVASGFVQSIDSCTGAVEFGSIFADVGAGFSAGPKSATLNASIVVTMTQFDSDFHLLGTVDRTLVASGLTWTSDQIDTWVAKSHSRTAFPGTKSVSNSQSTTHGASLSGALTLDGQNVLSPDASSLFETSSNGSVTVTKY
jgi:hypothetical protein